MKEEYFFLYGKNKKEVKKDEEGEDYRDPIDLPDNQMYHTRNNFSLKEQREMLDKDIHMDTMDDISSIEDDEKEEKKTVINSISKKEKILKEIQDPEYYGDPLEDSDNRKMYHAYDNFSKEQQEDMVVSDGMHIDTMDDIKPIEYDKEEKKSFGIVEEEPKIKEIKEIDNTIAKKDRVVFIDMADKITGISEDFARTETSNKKPTNFLDRMKNFFSSTINYDVKFARQRSIAEKIIYENEDLFANDEKKKGKKATEKEKDALLERANNEFLLEGETLEDLEKNVQNKIKEAIKIYVFSIDNSCEAKLKDSIFEIMSDVFEEDIKANEKLAKAFKIDVKKILATKYASNVLDLAKRIKEETEELRYKDQDAVLKRIENIEIKKANVFGGQLTTEKLGKVEGILNKVLRKAPILSSLDYVAVSVGTILATTVAKSVATSLTAGVGGIALGTTLSGIKESRKIEKDRVQVAREFAIGYESSMYDEKIKDLKELAKLAEEALKKSGKKEEIINKIKDLKVIDVEDDDTFVDMYLKICKFDMKGDKEISKIMIEIDSICKKYYKGKKSKEYKKINDEVDKINKESRIREVMRQFTYEQRPAKELNKFLNIEEGELTPKGFRFVFGNLLDAILRQNLSASYRIDLIEYTDQDKIEQERTLLALNIANAKSRLRKQFNSLSEENKKEIFANEYDNIKDKDFDYILNKYVNSKIEDFKVKKDRIDDEYKKYKKSQVTKRVLTTAGTSAVFSIAAQEIGALFDDKTYGLLERALDKGAGMNGPQKQTMLDYLAGGLLEKGKITMTDNLDQAYRMLDGAIGKYGVKIEQVLDRGGLHMNNNTQAFDLNELKLDIGKSGEKIFASMRRMLNGGSFRDGISINPSDKNLVFKLLLSLSDSSKQTPISIPFDTSGNLIIPDSLKFLFGNNGEFLGKYAEVAAYDKAGNILGILATHVGKGISGQTAVNTITQFTNPSFFGVFIPSYRRPLERAEKHNQKIERRQSNILNKKEVATEPTIETVAHNIKPIIDNDPVENVEPVTPVVIETVPEKGDAIAESPIETIEPVTVVKESIEPVVAEIIPDEKEVTADNKKTKIIEEKKDNDILSSIINEMKHTVDEKRLQNIKMFRVATFILQKYGDPKKIEAASKIKDKEQRRNTYREIMLESWKEFAIHKKPDLDCHGVLFLLNAAGFEINNVSILDKGSVKKDVVNFDTGNVNGLETYKYKNPDNTTKYDYAVVDHHGETLDIENSSTKYLYDFLTTLGFIEDRTGYLKAIVEFITREDNKDYEFTEKDYRNSASNLFGYSGYITQEHLTKLLNDEDIKDKFLEMSDVKDNFKIESMYLSNNELKRLGLFEYKKNRIYAIGKTIDSMKRLEDKDKKLKSENKEGLIYNIDKYNILINENYIIKFPTDIAIAKGYNVIVSYSDTNNKFSASFLKNSMPELSNDFKKKMEEYGIINIRNAMLIKDVKNEKAKPIDRDFIYGPNGLINELKK